MLKYIVKYFHKLSAGDTYNLIKTLDVCNYDSERQV
ncbi:DUF4049 domain-containing protein, partial [Escherichia coli]